MITCITKFQRHENVSHERFLQKKISQTTVIWGSCKAGDDQGFPSPKTLPLQMLHQKCKSRYLLGEDLGGNSGSREEVCGLLGPCLNC